MVPMIDPMVPDATALLVISPTLVGVMVAFLVAAAVAVVGTARELLETERPRGAAPSKATANAPAPLAA